MLRRQLFEFEDLPWFPAPLRAAMTSYLAASYRLTPLPALWAAKLRQVLNETGSTSIVDLCSGSGGPMPAVSELLNNPASITLTDLYPDTSFTHPSIRYWNQPISATDVPPELRGLRTMFTAFHHFDDSIARKILESAYVSKQPICIFEGSVRTIPSIAAACFIPLIVLIMTPTIRPVSFFRLVFTYLIPILPLVILWDGMISQLRTRTTEELRQITAGLEDGTYFWEAGEISAPRMPSPLPYLIGRPRLVQ